MSDEKKVLSKSDVDKLKTTDDILQEAVYVQEWDAWVNVRGLTGKQRDAFDASCYTGSGRDRDFNFVNARARLVALCVVDEHGNRIFAAEDVAWLGEKSAAALDTIYKVAARLSGITPEEQGVLEKSLPTVPNEDSGSG